MKRSKMIQQTAANTENEECFQNMKIELDSEIEKILSDSLSHLRSDLFDVSSRKLLDEVKSKFDSVLQKFVLQLTSTTTHVQSSYVSDDLDELRFKCSSSLLFDRESGMREIVSEREFGERDLILQRNGLFLEALAEHCGEAESNHKENNSINDLLSIRRDDGSFRSLPDSNKQFFKSIHKLSLQSSGAIGTFVGSIDLQANAANSSATRQYRPLFAAVIKSNMYVVSKVDDHTNACVLLLECKKGSNKYELSSQQQYGILRDPRGVVVDDRSVYIADSGARQIQQLSQANLWHSRQLSGFDQPCGMAVSNDELYVADMGDHKIKVHRNGKVSLSWGRLGDGDGEYSIPCGVAVDENFVYVVDSGNCRIQVLNKSDGSFSYKWGSKGSGEGQFQHPWAVAIDSRGYCYVGDFGDNYIQVFKKNGEFVRRWGRTDTIPLWLIVQVPCCRSPTNDLVHSESFSFNNSESIANISNTSNNSSSIICSTGRLQATSRSDCFGSIAITSDGKLIVVDPDHTIIRVFQ